MDLEYSFNKYHVKVISCLQFMFRNDTFYQQRLKQQQIQTIKQNCLIDISKCMFLGMTVINLYKFTKGRQNYQNYMKGVLQGSFIGLSYSFFYVWHDMNDQISECMAKNRIEQMNQKE